MPRGESPYLELAQFIAKKVHARGVFLYVDDGERGSSWCVWAPPEVAARLPEFIDDGADELLAEEAGKDGRVVLPEGLRIGKYVEASEAACIASNAEWAFVYVVEGDQGSGWSIFAPPTLSPAYTSELLHGFAEDLKGEEPVIRGEATLQ